MRVLLSELLVGRPAPPAPPRAALADRRAARDQRLAALCAAAGLGFFAAIRTVTGSGLDTVLEPSVVVGLIWFGLLCRAAPLAGDLARRSGPRGWLVAGAAYGLACIVVPVAMGGLTAMHLDAHRASAWLLGQSPTLVSMRPDVPRALSWDLGEALFDYVARPVFWIGLYGALPGIGLGVAFAACARR